MQQKLVFQRSSTACTVKGIVSLKATYCWQNTIYAMLSSKWAISGKFCFTCPSSNRLKRFIAHITCLDG